MLGISSRDCPGLSNGLKSVARAHARDRGDADRETAEDRGRDQSEAANPTPATSHQEVEEAPEPAAMPRLCTSGPRPGEEVFPLFEATQTRVIHCSSSGQSPRTLLVFFLMLQLVILSAFVV